MKQLLISFFSSVAGLALALPFLHPHVAQAQGLNRLDIQHGRAVAFVKTDRSVLYIKRPGKEVDSYDLVAMLQQAMLGNSPLDSIRHLAVIGMDPDSNRIILGGDVYYLDQFSSTHQMFEGIFRLPWPLTDSNLLNDPPFEGSGAPRWFLFQSPTLGDFHASGILSPDGKQWFAATRTWSPGQEIMQFYHGSTSGGTVDTATITQEIAGNKNPPAESWIESNIALDTTNNTMLVVEVDGLEAFASQSQRYLLIHWNPSAPGGVQAKDLTTALQGKSGKIQFAIDSCFGVSVVPVQDGNFVDVGFQYLGGAADTNHDIEYYKVQYSSSSGASLANDNLVLPRSALPNKSYTFFAGQNTNLYKDDNPAFHEHGQSGDIMVTNDRNTALFITHEWPENQNTFPGAPRNKYSAVFSYDFNGSGQATMLYNDTNAQELQPVFVPSTDTIPHVAGITAPATINFNTVDTGKTGTQSVTITDTSAWNGTKIDSVKITGDNEFTVLTSGTSFPMTITYGGTGQINLQFAPVGAAGARNATLNIYSSLSADKVVTVNLTGTAKVAPPPNSVKEDPSLAADVSIEPNPFSSAEAVQLTAESNESLGILVHDAVGRLVYTSPVQHVAAGAAASFSFDAKSLSLPNGIYYVTAIFGDRQVTRQVVFVR